MRISSTYLLVQGAETSMPASAVVAQLQTGNWIQETPVQVVTSILSDPEVLEQCLPYLPESELGNLMPGLPNECRSRLLKRSTKAGVMKGLSRTGDMSEDVFDVFVTKGNKVSLREFLLHFATGARESIYSANQLMRVWTQLASRYSEISSTLPASWTGAEVSAAFGAVTDLLPQLRKGYQMQSAAHLWRIAEVAGVVSDTQRATWYSVVEEPVGPRAYYASRGLQGLREERLSRPGVGASEQEKALAELALYGDLAGILELPEVIGDLGLVNRRSNLRIHLSPHIDEILGKCSNKSLLSLLSAGMPLHKAVENCDSVTTLFGNWYDNHGLAKTLSFPEDIVMELQPPTAVYVAKVHKGDFTLESLMGYLNENFGDNEGAWQFFWDSYAGWNGSMRSLVETALAVI